ncbi:MAG: YncE family protein [Planctomycetota bacterium]
MRLNHRLSIIFQRSMTCLLFLTFLAPGVAFGPNQAWAQYVAYVVNGNNVSAIDTSTNEVVSAVWLGGNSYGVAVSPDSTYVYATSYSNDDLSVIKTATFKVVATIPVGEWPLGVAISPDGTRVYVANQNPSKDGTVSVIDTVPGSPDFHKVVATVTVGSYPGDVATTPDGTRAYVVNYFSDTVSVIDTTSNGVVDTIAVGDGPGGIAITPGGTRAYVVNNGSNNVSVIDTVPGSPDFHKVVATVSVGSSPTVPAISQDGSYVYVTNFGSDTVSVIDTTSNGVVATIAVGDAPGGIAVTPDGTKVYVSNHYPDIVSVIDTDPDSPTFHTVVDTVPMGGWPARIVIAPKPPNLAPTVDAGPDLTVTAFELGETIVHGTASDPDGDNLMYRWLEGTTALSPYASVDDFGRAPLDLSILASPLGVGDHTLTLEVSDGWETVTDEMVLTVAVPIDIMPGSDLNNVSLCSRGVMPVAILGSADLDVNVIVTQTLELAGSGVKVVGIDKLLASVRDVNNDGFDDLVVQIEVENLDLTEGDIEAVLTGELMDGTPIEGTDSVNIVRDCP